MLKKPENKHEGNQPSSAIHLWILFFSLFCISVPVLNTQAQIVPRGLLEATNRSSGNTGPMNPSDLIAGPFPLSGSSAYGICFMPDNNPWAQPILVVAELFSSESWVYDALTLAPIGTILNPPAGISVTGVTTDGTYLYWGVINPPGPNEIWRTNPDGTNPSLIGTADIQGGGFVGGLSWNGSDGIWAADITADQYDLLSIVDGSYLGSSVSHPDGGGLGNGLAFRADCNRLSIPHGSDLAGRVTTLSSVSIQSSIPLSPVDLSNHGFFINGIESSRPAVAPSADPFGTQSYWVVDNSSNTISIVEGHTGCPSLISPISGFECSAFSDGTLQATWNPNTSATAVEIRVNGILTDTVTASSGSWVGVTNNLPSVILIHAQGFAGDSWTPPVSCQLLAPGCDPAAVEWSHAIDPEVFSQGTPFCGDAAGHREQSYWRRWSLCSSPFQMSSGMTLESIRIGVENSSPGIGFTQQPLTLRIYQDVDGDEIDAPADLILLHEQTYSVPPVEMSAFCLTLDSPVEIPCGLNVVTEFHLPDGSLDGHLLILGSNSLGETDPTWFSASFCGSATPTNLTDLGYPDIHLVATLRGNPIAASFRRGDINADNSVNLADAVFLLESLFIPGSMPINCLDAADCNDDEGVNLADAIYLLSHLFIPGSPPLPDPQGTCSIDPTEANLLSCDFSANCP
ncbi:hypothetical protein CBD41_00885 [bacterium TMED181]|nr:hypothetical protein [Planctomycetota bacterium]OUW47487.1 MAG: hypothetical protein CBD41_00885 [bacterium TMED181]